MTETTHQKEMAKICELAYEETVKECKRRGIKVVMVKDGFGGTRYTKRAQDIFNDFYDDIESKRGINV